jgi:PAS domain S-box-containing protein
MQKLTHLLGGFSKDRTTRRRPLDRNQILGLSHDALITTVGLASIAILGWINLKAMRGLSFEFFYLLGCCWVGWLAGARSALICTVLSAICLCLAEMSRGSATGAGWLFAWNSLVRLLAFGAITWLAGEAGRLTRELERTVQHRTKRLANEVEEHKATARLLRETLDLFKQVAENITDVFWVTDPGKHRVEYVSPAFEGLWGETRQTLYTSPGIWLEAVHPEDRERVTRATFAQQLTGEYNEEYRIVRPDRSLRWVQDRAFPVKDEAGKVYRVVGIAADITERKRNEHLLQAQRNMAVALSSTSDLKFALDRLLEVGAELEGIDCGGVYLADVDTGELHLEAHRGLPDSFLSRVSHYNADAIEVRLVKGGDIFYAREEQIPRSLEVLWGSQGLRALAVAPVRHQDALLGLLILASWREGEIPPRTRVGIELLASQVSGAVARIRAEHERFRLQREILEISDREQARIGQDVHDGLCQQLIGVAFNANSLEQALASQQRPEAATARKVCTLLDEAITESRRVCRGLYPIRLRTEGLVPALEELAATTTERYQVNCRCDAEVPHLHCDVATATHLYRIAQEAMNNALKHSGASHITLQLREPDDGIELQVIDDGKGLNATPGSGSGMGLHIMDYRARLIGGSFQFHRGPNGASVTCRVPQVIR